MYPSVVASLEKGYYYDLNAFVSQVRECPPESFASDWVSYENQIGL